jgi:uncharacterized zinc-type alcohol dehydrogenase-like protein
MHNGVFCISGCSASIYIKYMFNAKAYTAQSATSPLASTTITPRDPTEHDIQTEILYCGICHSDLHTVRNEWKEAMPTVYPCVPGHEIVGRVTKVGPAVTKFKPGDLAAVGYMVDSDGTCLECRAGLEQFCPNTTSTYNSPDKHLGGVTYGGYSDSMVVDQRFVLRALAGPCGARAASYARKDYRATLRLPCSLQGAAQRYRVSRRRRP